MARSRKFVEMMIYQMEEGLVSVRATSGHTCLPQQLYTAGFRSGDITVLIPRERLSYLEQLEYLATKFMRAQSTSLEVEKLIQMLDPYGARNVG